MRLDRVRRLLRAVGLLLISSSGDTGFEVASPETPALLLRGRLSGRALCLRCLPSALVRRRDEFSVSSSSSPGASSSHGARVVSPERSIALLTAVNDEASARATGLGARRLLSRTGVSSSSALPRLSAPLAPRALGWRRFLLAAGGRMGPRGLWASSVPCSLLLAPLGAPRVRPPALPSAAGWTQAASSATSWAHLPYRRSISRATILPLPASSSGSFSRRPPLSLGDGLSGSALHDSELVARIHPRRQRRRKQTLKGRQRSVRESSRSTLRKLAREKEDYHQPPRKRRARSERRLHPVRRHAPRQRKRSARSRLRSKSAGRGKTCSTIARPALLEERRPKRRRRILPFPPPPVDASGWVFPPAKLLRAA